MIKTVLEKIKKILGIIISVLLIISVLALAVIFIYHRVMLSKENELLGDYPGQLVEVNGHNMNVYVSGEGDHTLVFLAPAGDCTPVYTFEPLCTALDKDCRTVVIEKFGYGMSDNVDGTRDYKTMVDECRQALDKVGIEAPYILCPFSKSGIDALIWSQSYPDEVEAIVSLDMAFPEHYDQLDLSNIKDQSGLIGFLRSSGIIRLFVPDSLFPEDMPAERRSMEKAMIIRNYSNKVLTEEVMAIPAACDMINSGSKPSCPMLLFLSDGRGTDMDTDTWRGITYSYTDGLDASYTEFDCEHNELVEKCSAQIADEIREFTDTLD